MNILAIVLCIFIFAFSPSSHPRHSKAYPLHLDRIFLDVDHKSGEKAWLRVNNESDFDIYVPNFPAPKGCEDFPNYYLERVVQRKFTDDDRRFIVEHEPSAAEKTDEEIGKGLPRTITIREEREIHWSDGISMNCGTLRAKQSASFEISLRTTQDYDRLYVPYYYEDGDPVSFEKAPQHRLYFELKSLREEAPKN